MNADANSDAIESVSRVSYYGISDQKKEKKKKNLARIGWDACRLNLMLFLAMIWKYVCVSHLHGT